MLFKWLDGSEATQVGATLADDFYLQSSGGAARRTQHRPEGPELQKFLQKFLQQVDRAVQPLKLNVFKRAKLANSFKWRLLEKGVEQDLVDELTQALVLRLTSPESSAMPSGPATAVNGGGRHRRREVAVLLAEAESHLSRGAYLDAGHAYEEVLQADPRNAAAYVGLGGALFRQGRLQEAEAEVRRALAIKPNYPEAHSNLGTVLQAHARYLEAEQSYRRALKLKPVFLDARLNLGIVLSLLGRYREAQDSFEKVLRVEPRNPRALVGLGRNHALQGHFTEAESLYKRALDIDSKRPRAWAGLVELRRMTRADEGWLKGAEACAEGGMASLDEVALRFAIGKYHDDLGEFERAFRSYRTANELLKASARPYDPAARASLVGELIGAYSRAALSRSHPRASSSQQPVLVIGMPRSGTSLVEQIIASHPDASGAGELDFWSRALHKDQAALRSGEPGDALAAKLVTGYLRELNADSRNSPRVVDKTPINSDNLGLIHRLFPQARVIYVRRDPIDTCLSCYFQNFSVALNFTNDLADLADYYRQHQRLLAHWRSALPAGTMLEVPYEELVADQEAWTRRILDFISLPWDPRCLDFQSAERTVFTASYWQVRQKMYKTSVERWRNYEKFIGPLRSLKDLPTAG
ncbi:MAG TPA: sulfotransferase [Steroidobacteraceae bacterium]|nr:sulfotransferase [Steroidobacteraceae bacterium]